VLVFAGCGGSDGEQESGVVGPRIEGATANDLAALSEEVADRLESGDQCGAAESATQLRDRMTAAINDGKVPELYLEELSGIANELQLQVQPCSEPAPPPPPPDEDDEEEQEDGDDDGGKRKGKDKKKKDKHEDAETIPSATEPSETLTDETTTAEPTTTTTPTTTTETQE
jgi:hypothetical protein